MGAGPASNMLKTIERIFDEAFARREQSAAVDHEHALRIATAVLLLEVTRADYAEEVTEKETTYRLLQRHFELNDETTEALMAAAEDRSEASVGLHDYTRLLHEYLQEEEKHRVVEMLWRVALADKILDKHEDYLIGRISELLYVRRNDVLRLKDKVRRELRAT